MAFGSANVWPQLNVLKSFGTVLRCVRDTVIATLPILPNNCNQDIPGWGEGPLGASFVSTQTWIVGAGDSTQIWSDAVTATACAGRAAVFSGEAVGSFNADCRPPVNNPIFTGDLFSWCAVMRFADSLCPAPWRVPTAADFRQLHTNITGQVPPSAGTSVPIVPGTYIATTPNTMNGGIWGGTRSTGWAGSLTNAGSYYWSSAEATATNARALRIYVGAAGVTPEHTVNKRGGFALRCVRDTVTSCNNNTPGWGASLGTITWGNTSNTNIESGTSVVPGTDGRPTQIWSGAVFATACSSNMFNGGEAGNFNADCRQTTGSINNRATSPTGDLFSWCAVMRFASQLCPAPWRVPTGADFSVLHRNLGYPDPSLDIVAPSNIPNTYTGVSGTTAAPQVGGVWGGASWTGFSGNLTQDNAFYWSSTVTDATRARCLYFHQTTMFYGHSVTKNLGLALRCVR